MDKPLNRAEIDELLTPRPGQGSSQLAGLTMEGLEATLKGIAAGEFRSGYAIHYAATAMGYLLAGCTEQAAWAARQAVAPYALPAAARQALPAELLAGVAKLRLLPRKASR